MRRISVLRLLALAIFSPIALLSAHAAVPNRIVSAVSNTSRATIPNTIPGRARHATDLGDTPGSTKLEAMTLRFSLTDAQSAALDNLLMQQQNPSSSLYHQWLTPAQYAAQFGISAADLAKVTAWLTSQGLTVTGVANSATFVSFSGTVAQVQAAFNTSIHNLSVDGETHFANITDPAIPAALSGVVSGITGLHNFKLRSRARTSTVEMPKADTTGLRPQYTSSVSGNHYIAPGDFYTIYDENPLLTNSINGSGITIAVMGQVDISLPDVAAFRTASGLTANVPTVKVYGTDPGAATSSTSTPSTGDLAESMLDVEWSGAVAPSASILFVNSTDVIGISLTQAIDNNIAPIMTVSYGDCEANWGNANLNTLNQLFKQANVQGITVMGPAGDDGATDCDENLASAVSGLAVDFPASSPYVTGLGGSEFNEGTGTYWSTTNGATGGSALSYIPEMVWNETVVGTAGFAAGGGGLSLYFSKPAWQIGTGVPADASRDVPDLSLNAAASHDGYLYCVSGSCTGGTYRASNGTSLAVVGGTSVATPAFAGILALIEQKIGSRVGNANPTLYALANSTYYSSVFHDITVGNNNSPCTTGTPNCPTGGTIGYAAGTGYDQATGWGSVDAFALANDWKLVTPLSLGTNGTSLSLTSVTTSTASVKAGATVSVTAQIASGTSGVTATPTGTVQFLVDNVLSGSAVALSSGSATYSFTLSATASSGVHTVSASYSGDTNYTGSKGSVQVDVVSATAADFTLTPTTATITTKSGTTSTGVTYTVTPVNGFIGNVAFTATTTSSSLAATYSFSVSPVAITTTAAGTTVFTLSAYQSAGQTSIGQHRLVSSTTPPARTVPWYTAGSGLTLASLLLFTLPRKRRFGALLVLALSLATIGGITGCGTSTSATSGVITTNATTGTYAIVVIGTYTNTATGAVISHSVPVSFVVQ